MGVGFTWVNLYGTNKCHKNTTVNDLLLCAQQLMICYKI